MKQKKFTIISKFVADNLILEVAKIEYDGKTTVTIGDTGTKSARQRGYEWILYEAIAKSGLGGRYEDEKNNVHFICKYRFCIPILLRDSPYFAEIWDFYKQMYGKDTERMEFFISSQVHTEKLSTSQMAEYLTELINYYTSKGFELPDPDLKLLEREE